jgi:hypothetical protein
MDCGPLWRVFVSKHEAIAARLVDGHDAQVIDRELTSLVSRCHPDLDWEMGPKGAYRLFFCASPSGRADLLAVARQCVLSAPALSGWAFRAGKPPRNWSRRVIEIPLPGNLREVELDRWSYQIVGDRRIALLPDLRAGVELAPSSLRLLCRHLAHAELGEAFVIDQAIQVDLATERSRDAAGQQWRSIAELREHALSVWRPLGGPS